MDNLDRQHWDSIFSSTAESERSWFQSYPKTSIDFVNFLELPLDANIIDIGGGDSYFVDALLEKGYQNIYVLDISTNALSRAKRRLGEKALKVHWILSDVTDFNPPVKFDLWHDRAAFHFLTTEDKIDRYLSIAQHAVNEGGWLVMGTFSENGPQKCSGLEVQQYSEASLVARFEFAFDKIKCQTVDHLTPSGASQNFIFCCFRKRAAI